MDHLNRQDLTIQRLGPCRYDSPFQLSHEEGDYVTDFVEDDERILFPNRLSDINYYLQNGLEIPSLEAAGPRDKIFFNPHEVKAAIVTCGGLCPGINDVIRGLVLGLRYQYGVEEIYGIRYGFKGMVERSNISPIMLNPERVENIHNQGGTFLGSSRGPQSIEEMVDFLTRRGINQLFTIGGDGTQRGALEIIEKIKKRNLNISVVGIPKTIDNDICYIEKSFGFETSYSVATEVLESAHNEANGAFNGIALVKLMGRESGFIAATASVASGVANFTLLPEIPFDLEAPNGLLPALEKRLLKRHHAVIVVAEGAGQDLMQREGDIKKDASGNIKLQDIGAFLYNRIHQYFEKRDIEFTVKYIDPSYIVRSLPANPSDSMFCLRLAHNAIHAAMAGRTGLLVGFWNSSFIHLPIEASVSGRKRVDSEGDLWLSVLETTGQPLRMINP